MLRLYIGLFQVSRLSSLLLIVRPPRKDADNSKERNSANFEESVFLSGGCLLLWSGEQDTHGQRTGSGWLSKKKVGCVRAFFLDL